MVGMVNGGKVVALPAAADDAAADTISLLEDALEFARANPCHTVCIFLMGRDGLNTFFDGTSNRTLAVGSLVQLQHRLMDGD